MKLRRAMAVFRGSGAGLYVVAAVLLAVIAGGLVMGWMRSAVPSHRIWVAKRDLPPGSVLTAGDFEPKEVPEKGVPPGAVQDPGTVEGRRLYSSLVAGDTLRTGHVFDGEGGDLPARLAELGSEYRAIALPSEVIPALGRLAPGDRLEVVAVVPHRSGTANTEVAIWVSAGTVIEIIADRDESPLAALLAVRVEDVPKLALALRAGTVMATITARRDDGQYRLPEAPPLRLETLTAEPLSDEAEEDTGGRK